MASQPLSIAYFEIVPARGLKARYGSVSTTPAAGDHYPEQVQNAANSRALQGNVVEIGQPSDYPAERFLDIVEQRHDDHGADNEALDNMARVYAFRLNARENGRDLSFVADRPIIALPTNFGPGEDFISDIRTYSEEGQTRWASFVCDLGAVRKSALADRIRTMVEKYGHGRNPDFRPVLALPFCFNVRDSALDAAPWVVDPTALLILEAMADHHSHAPDHDHDDDPENEHGHEHDDEGSAAGDLAVLDRIRPTHGGVHPAGVPIHRTPEGLPVIGKTSGLAGSLGEWLTHGGVHPPLTSFLIVEL